MVQGNWERRAEMSETRRLEAKQRKQRNADRKVYKLQAQELMTFLNQNTAQLLRGQNRCQTPPTRREELLMIHVWTDSQPRFEDDSHLDGPWEDECMHGKHKNGKQGRRGRSISIENSDVGRQSKNNRSSGKKKSHPRSKESSSNNVENEEVDSTQKPKLCRSHFFFGKCNESTGKRGASSGKKSYGCRFAHYAKRDKTLSDVLVSKTPCDGGKKEMIEFRKKIISESELSYPEATMVGDKTPTAEAMDMIFYSSFSITDLFGTETYTDDLSSGTFSHAVVDAMAKQSCNIGSIVYFAIGEQLLYDRYRKGVIVEETDLMRLERRISFGSDQKSVGDRVESISLSASILEYILTFLEDDAVASMSSVSRSWNREIGRQSANLWKYLLNRRQWPIPKLDDLSEQETLSTLRNAFISHYTAMRDINGVKIGVDCLFSRKSMSEFQGSARSFESLRNSPQNENHCVDVKIWAANSFLAAYSQDCTIRLFDSVEGSESSGERLCRELVCYCVDPHKMTKKRNCEMIAVALDTDFIGCLLYMTDDVSEENGFILTVLSRENFLIDDASNDGAVQVIYVRQSVLNFLLICDEVDHSLLELHDFLANDGDLDEVEVIVSPTLVDCGYGRFMVEVSVAIPSTDFHETDSRILFRKLFLFSTSIGAITWMSDSGDQSVPFQNTSEGMTLASASFEGNGRYRYEIASVSCSSSMIANLSLDSAGNIIRSIFIQAGDLTRTKFLEDGWVMIRSRKRPVVIFQQTLVVADNFARGENEERQSVVSFVQLDGIDHVNRFPTLCLSGNLEICHLVALRSSHVVAICKRFERNSDVTAEEDIDGHWFGPRINTTISIYAVIIDVQSKKEVYRTCLVDDLYMQMTNDHSSRQSVIEGELPIYLATKSDTVVAGISAKGVIMAGADSRRSRSMNNYRSAETPSKSTKKAKKKKIGKKSGKKDGFARGQKM